MGTSAIIQVNVDDQHLVAMYVPMDGYLDGVGKTMLPILKRKHVNGYTDDQTQYNRVGNFCALVIATLINQHTDISKRVAEFSNMPVPQGLACGGVEIINDVEKHHSDYVYTINFTHSLNNPKAPKINVSSYGKSKKNLSVLEFESFIAEGFEEN
ncbi:TPA: hypothetical protein PRO12_002320 [Acinetobacter baumannii]|nr:hypothetical protein [Acinetobacter baumannii]